MAGQNRNQNPDLTLEEQLAREPWHFGFYEALRQLECRYRDHARIGYAARPVDDAVRFGQTPSLQFAPSTLAEFSPKSQDLPRLAVYFFGVLGANGPLPLHLTEYVRNRVRNAKDKALADFLDLFHHRLLSLFYRAWADKEPTVQLDRPDGDRFAFYVGTMLGVGETSLRDRDAMPDHDKLHFAAHLGCHTRHAEGLASILAAFFHMPIRIQEFVGEWLEMPEDSYCYLDAADDSTGQLGVSATIGTRSWQCQNKFRIVLGPVSLAQYSSLLPNGESSKRLVAIVRNYIGFELNWDVNLVLQKQDVSPVRLGEYGQLGWTSWLQGGKRTTDANDLYLNTEDMA